MPDPRILVTGPRVQGATRWFTRYRPFLLTALAVLLIAVFLPGRDRTSDQPEEAATLTSGLGEQAAASAAGEGNGSATGDPTSTGAAVADPGRTANRAQEQVSSAVRKGVKLVANCDKAKGHIKIPSWTAPACVPALSGRNTGNDYQGVTADKIKLAVYIIQEDATTDAILRAAGADDTPAQIRQQYRDWATFYSKHFNTWGRKIELHFVDGSGAGTDDAAGKADAIKIATQIKPYATLNAPNKTFVEELVARKIPCICTTSLPNELYLKWAPYVWSTLMSSTQGYVHRAEYVAKRLAGRNAKWAYDEIVPTQQFKQTKRVLGLIYYDTTDFAYKSGIDSFVRELAKYGVTLKVKVEYNGYPDIEQTQIQARPVIQKLKDAGVTTVICACDPFGPIFFTQEATRQLYGPEWVITGSALTDTSFFARLYDQAQWSHAFGISFLTARVPERISDSYSLLRWHFGKEPSAPAGYGIFRLPMDIVMRGIHHAGPTLNPQTFKKGLFEAPPTGLGKIVEQTSSFGRRYWRQDDYMQYDDVTEIWWDSDAQGEDEIGADGSGLYRYVLGGKRYLPGTHPKTEPKAFNKAGTSTIYAKHPPGNAPPQYPRP